MTEEPRTIVLSGRTVPYLLRRNPRSRGVRLTIDDRRGLVVSVPIGARRGWHAPEPRVEAFIRQREPWVVRHLDRLEGRRAQGRSLAGVGAAAAILFQGQPHALRLEASDGLRSHVERVGGPDGDELVVRISGRERRAPAAVLETWLRERARRAVREAVDRHAAALGVAPSAVVLRDPRSRWGSASRKGRVMLSWRLVLAPPASLETVVVHELAHLRVFGHGPRFWALVAARRPTHLRDRAWLRSNAHLLHAALRPEEDGIALGA